MNTEIILIGPMGAGKSTVGKLLAEKLELPQISLDELRWKYYAEQDYDDKIAQQLIEQKDYFGLERYWNNYDPYAIKRILTEHHNCIFDFGAGHTVYQDTKLFGSVRDLLKSYPNVVLLLPAPDPAISVQILQERNLEFDAANHNLNEFFVRYPGNYELAKFVVYTQERTPEQTCNEILDLVKL